MAPDSGYDGYFNKLTHKAPARKDTGMVAVTVFGRLTAPYKDSGKLASGVGVWVMRNSLRRAISMM